VTIRNSENLPALPPHVAEWLAYAKFLLIARLFNVKNQAFPTGWIYPDEAVPNAAQLPLVVADVFNEIGIFCHQGLGSNLVPVPTDYSRQELDAFHQDYVQVAPRISRFLKSLRQTIGVPIGTIAVDPRGGPFWTLKVRSATHVLNINDDVPNEVHAPEADGHDCDEPLPKKKKGNKRTRPRDETDDEDCAGPDDPTPMPFDERNPAHAHQMRQRASAYVMATHPFWTGMDAALAAIVDFQDNIIPEPWNLAFYSNNIEFLGQKVILFVTEGLQGTQTYV
jgi:hypothetical protein